MSRAPAAQPRRMPNQTRSRRLVARILAAAARVFAEVGFQAATTNRIAEEAGVSVGSLYQFFPNKAALLAVLRQEWLDRVQAAIAPALAPEPRRPVAGVVREVILAFERLDRAQPGLLRVLMTHDPQETVADHERAHASVVRAISGQVEALLAAWAPGLEAGRRGAVAWMCIHLADALFAQPGPNGEGFHPALVREVEAALLGYLGPLVEGEPEAARRTDSGVQKE